MTLTKRFVQKLVSHDCEARDFEWEDTNEEYEVLAKRLWDNYSAWFKAARIVEKVFDDETFTITVKPIKTTRRKYDDEFDTEEVEG